MSRLLDPPKPGVITAIQVLLSLQFGLGFLQCGMALFAGELMKNGIFPSEVPPPPAENRFFVGAVIFAVVIAVISPQLLVIAMKLPSRRRAVWVWALSVLSAPFLLLAGFALMATLDVALMQINTLRAIGGAALYCAPIPMAAIICLLTPSARAWLYRDKPVAVEPTVISWWG